MAEFDPKLKMLEIAIDTRKFEIEMYWKRATYFWAFIAISFTGYFAFLNSSSIKTNKEITIVISLIGLLFSFGWYLVNRGSKFWQENWERHVTSVEKEVLKEELFNKVINPTTVKWYRLHEGLPVSVSKINQILSMSIVLIWFYLILYSVGFYLDLSAKYVWFDTFKKNGLPPFRPFTKKILSERVIQASLRCALAYTIPSLFVGTPHLRLSISFLCNVVIRRQSQLLHPP